MASCRPADGTIGLIVALTLAVRTIQNPMELQHSLKIVEKSYQLQNLITETTRIFVRFELKSRLIVLGIA